MARTSYKYTPEEKEKFVQVCASLGGNVYSAARLMRIPLASARRIWLESDMSQQQSQLEQERYSEGAWLIIFKVLRLLRRRLTLLEPEAIRAYTQLVKELHTTQAGSSQTKLIEKKVFKIQLSDKTRSLVKQYEKSRVHHLLRDPKSTSREFLRMTTPTGMKEINMEEDVR